LFSVPVELRQRNSSTRYKNILKKRLTTYSNFTEGVATCSAAQSIAQQGNVSQSVFYRSTAEAVV
jgi:hypothetical protein